MGDAILLHSPPVCIDSGDVSVCAWAHIVSEGIVA